MGVTCILLLAAVASLILDDHGAPALPASESHDRLPLKLRLLVAAYGLFGFGYVITATFLVAIVRRSQVIAPLEPWIWIVFGVCAMPSVALWNHLSSQWGILNTFAVACLVEAIGVAASLIGTAVAGVLLAAILLWWHVHGVNGSGAKRGLQPLHRRPPAHHRLDDGRLWHWPDRRPGSGWAHGR